MYLYLINKPFQNAMYYLSVLSVKLLFLEVKSAESSIINYMENHNVRKGVWGRVLLKIFLAMTYKKLPRRFLRKNGEFFY